MRYDNPNAPIAFPNPFLKRLRTLFRYFEIDSEGVGLINTKVRKGECTYLPFILSSNINAESLFDYVPPSSAFHFLLLPHGIVLIKIILLVTIGVILIVLGSGYIGTYCCDGEKYKCNFHFQISGCDAAGFDFRGTGRWRYFKTIWAVVDGA
jgi:hypothetical protein